MHVKCYGGPLHNCCRDVEELRFEIHAPTRSRPMFLQQQDDYPLFEPYRTTTYMVETFREQRGNMCREMKIAVVEGVKNLLPQEEYEISHDIRKEHWVPWHQPSILHEFDRWFNLCVYSKTLDSKYLLEEFQSPPRRR